ncbi:MAG TPA: prepilin peptidase [Micromonosporaceae bacterium]|nr:prepilin peptidase [Micromonosporaceae bacterium]
MHCQIIDANRRSAVSPLWTVPGLLSGVLLAPALRGQIFLHSVPSGQLWATICPSCHRRIRLIGFNARCPGCATRIGPPPGAVELVAGATLGLLIWRVPDPLPLLALSWIALVGVVLAFVDGAVHRLPDRLTLTAFVGAAFILALDDPTRAGWALLGSLALGGCYLLLAVANPAGMGLGDGKLALSLGLALGWFGWIAVIYGAAAGFVLSGLFAIAMLVIGRLGRKDSIAHGPFMLLGALAAITLLA